MDSNVTRSQQVVDDFKKRKAAHSALHNAHRIIESFDEDRKSDISWARIGLIALAILLFIALSIYLFNSGTTPVTIP